MLMVHSVFFIFSKYQIHIKHTSNTHSIHIKYTSNTHQIHIKHTSNTHQIHIYILFNISCVIDYIVIYQCLSAYIDSHQSNSMRATILDGLYCLKSLKTMVYNDIQFHIFHILLYNPIFILIYTYIYIYIFMCI